MHGKPLEGSIKAFGLSHTAFVRAISVKGNQMWFSPYKSGAVSGMEGIVLSIPPRLHTKALQLALLYDIPVKP